MPTPPTSRPTVMTNTPIRPPTPRYTPDNIFKVYPRSGWTGNSYEDGMGFPPNAEGIKRYRLLQEKENLKDLKKIKVSSLNDMWKAKPRIPGPTKSGYLAFKTIDGSDGDAMKVTISRDDGKYLYFNDDAFSIEKDGINDIFTFYEINTGINNAYRRAISKMQKGGFYPSVYGGIAGAKMLTPLVARQMLRMYGNKTRKSKSKKTNTRKTRLNA